MAAKASKKGKKKGMTMALTDFLSDEQGNVVGPGTSYVLANKTVDWAQEMEDLDNSVVDTPYSLSNVDRTKLPTAPKAARVLEDLDRVPKEPPFTAFIGNLPYEVSEEKIKDFFHKLPVVNIRLPEENGRFRGFGYVQFDTRQALIDALSRNEEVLAGRKVRVDLAGQSQHGERSSGGGSGRDGRNRDDGPDRTEGDWRRADIRPEPASDDRGPSRSFDDRTPSRGGFDDRRGFDDRGGRGYDDRGTRGGYGRNYDDRGGRGYDDRGGRGYDDRGGRGYDDRGVRGYDDRGGRGYDDRGGRGYDDRGGRGYDDRGGSRYDDRQGGYSRGDRDYQRGRDRYDDRDGGRQGYGSGFRDRDGDRHGYDDRGGYGRDRSDRDWGRGSQSDRNYDRPSYRSERQESREPDTPKERPKLHLQPRSKPIENTDATEKESKSSSIFGAAKPIDTARREREIEEKLQKQREVPPPSKTAQESRSYGSSRGFEDSRERRYEHDNKENREHPRPDRGSRKKSEGSDHEGERKRHSSSSSNKGKKGSRGRRESGESSGHGEVFSGGEESKDDKTHNPVSPSSKEEPQVFVPAPPPKQNVWEMRKSNQVASPPQQKAEPSSATVQESKSQPQTESVTDTSVNKTINQSDNQSAQSSHSDKEDVSHSGVNHSGGDKKDFVPAEPPKENPWTKRKQEREQQVSNRPSQPSSDLSHPRSGAPNAWAGRGRTDRGRGRGGFGRGRGGDPPKSKTERKEKPLPNSIDEMPKMETAAPMDFSDGNKFAGLLDDGDIEDDE